MENNEQDLAWHAAYGALRDWVRAHDRLPDRAETELYAWIGAQQSAYRRGELSPAKAALLDRVPGWHGGRDAVWRATYDALCAYEREHGRLPKTDEPRLGRWINAQRAAQSTGKLAPERAALLDRVPGWQWMQDLDGAWHSMYDVLCEFVRAHSRLPNQTDIVGEPPQRLRLGTWVHYQRQVRSSGRLDAVRVALLEAVPGWFWRYDTDTTWHAAYDALREFVRAHDRLPKKAETAGDLGPLPLPHLGMWVSTQKSTRRLGRLSAERAALLEAVPGWRWTVDPAEPAGPAGPAEPAEPAEPAKPSAKRQRR